MAGCARHLHVVMPPIMPLFSLVCVHGWLRVGNQERSWVGVAKPARHGNHLGHPALRCIRHHPSDVVLGGGVPLQDRRLRWAGSKPAPEGVGV